MATKKNTSINGNEYFRIRRTIDGRIKNFYGSSKGEFVSILEYVAETCGKRVVKVDRWAPTTKTCSVCGETSNLSLTVRGWTCPHCGARHDRDVNAAINIRNLALSA